MMKIMVFILVVIATQRRLLDMTELKKYLMC